MSFPLLPVSYVNITNTTMYNASMSNSGSVGPYGNSLITSMGYTSLWIGFAFTGFAAVLFFFLSYVRNVKPEARLVYYLVTLINVITALAYLLMAMGNTDIQGRNVLNVSAQYLGAFYGYGIWYPTSGSTPGAFIQTGARAFLWVRYAAWVVVGPITVVILGLLAGAHWVEQVWTLFWVIIGVAAGYAGATDAGLNATWPLLAFGVFTFFPVMVALVYTFRRTAYRVHAEIGKLYDVLAFSLVILFAGYASTWGVSEGGWYTTVDQEIIIYTVHDILTKVVFGFVLIWSREAIARFGNFLGVINTGADFDFPIVRSTYTSSADAYKTEPNPPVVLGEHRDLGFAQLHAATSTQQTVSGQNWWPTADVTQGYKSDSYGYTLTQTKTA
jgi:bacteriorhodopsin